MVGCFPPTGGLEIKNKKPRERAGAHPSWMLVPYPMGFHLFCRPINPLWQLRHLPLFLRHIFEGLETVATVRTQLGAWWAAAGASAGGDEERRSYLAGDSGDPKNHRISRANHQEYMRTRNFQPDEGNICKKPHQ